MRCRTHASSVSGVRKRWWRGARASGPCRSGCGASTSMISSRSGIFWVISPDSRQKSKIVLRFGGSAPFGRDDERHDHLAAVFVGDAEHRDVGDRRVRVEHVFDFLGRDVLALADDDVLDPAGDEDRAVLVEAAEVAGVQEAVGGERVRVERAVDVAPHHLRALHDDLALSPGGTSLPSRSMSFIVTPSLGGLRRGASRRRGRRCRSGRRSAPRSCRSPTSCRSTTAPRP